MENVNRNLRNRLHNNIQSYTRGRVNRGSANSKNFVNTINEIINVIHRGKVPGPRPGNNNRQLSLRPGNNNRQLSLRPGNNNRQLSLRPVNNNRRANMGSVNNNRQLSLRPGNNNRRANMGSVNNNRRANMGSVNNINRILNENADFRELMSTKDPERRKKLLRKLQFKHHPNKGGVNAVFKRLMQRAEISSNNRPATRNNNRQLSLRPGTTAAV